MNPARELPEQKWLSRLKTALNPPRWRKKDWFFLVAAVLAWPALIQIRPYTMTAHCTATATHCSPEHVGRWDRIALGTELSAADAASFETQNSAGALALAVPTLMSLGRGLVLKHPLSLIGSTIGTDLLIALETTTWNGTLNEIVRQVARRPRPFVYANLKTTGGEVGNYTSFYSGHTSFAAAITLCMILTLLGRNAPLIGVFLSGAAGYSLVFLTGLFRILSARHFPTDVIAGALAGTLVALWIALRHRAQD